MGPGLGRQGHLLPVHFGTVGGGGIGFEVVGGVGADVTGGEGGFTAPPLAGAPAPVGAGVDPDADPWVAGAAEAAALDAVEPEDPVDAAAPVSPAEPVDPGVVSVGLPALATVAADSGGTPTTLPYGSR